MKHLWLTLVLFGASCASSSEDLAVSDAPPAGSVEVIALQKEGFVVFETDGRYWIFREDSEDLAAYRQHGELAKCVTIIGQGPGGRTMKGPDAETCRAYMAACDGFYTELVDGRVWVFRDASPELTEFKEKGEPAKCVTLIGQGPMRMTLRGPDRETLAEYREALAL